MASLAPQVRSEAQVQAVVDVATRVEPVMLAGERRIEVAPALARVLPQGIQRGSTLGVRGPAAMSLALAVAAGPVAAGSWLAVMGCDELGLVGAEQAGVALHRMVLVSQPPRSSWGAVAAALVDAFDVVLVASTYPVGTRDARRLMSRARERGGVIIDASQSWPEVPDIVLEVVDQHWSGLGDGHGVLTARRVTIDVSGRRGTRPRRVPLWLPGPQQGPEAITPDTHAGADVDQLIQVDEVSEVDQSSALRRVG